MVQHCRSHSPQALVRAIRISTHADKSAPSAWQTHILEVLTQTKIPYKSMSSTVQGSSRTPVHYTVLSHKPEVVRKGDKTGQKTKSVGHVVS
jgi:hypothetical protein